MPSSMAALVLMGGQNKRMKGHHKAFLDLNGHSFLETILSQLEDFSHVYLSVDDCAKFTELEQPLIEDHYPGIGPIGGIASAFETIQADYLFVTACDMPFITKDYVSYMQKQLAALPNKPQCLVIHDEEGFFYPLGGIYSREMLPTMQAMIRAGNYRLQYLVRHSRSHIIPLSETPFSQALLRNINTPEDYKNSQCN